ncbi:MAG: AAA family ATPase [Bacteroidetes bacterium]|nr:MAG: AAA family ATPase [Bacteroidota bacterium]
MRIDKLHIKNFKCFADNDFVFNKQFNALIGDNGKGKTAILDAISVAAGSYFLGIDERDARGIYKNEIRRENYGTSIELQFPTIIDATGIIDNKTINWRRSVENAKNSTTRKDAIEIMQFAKSNTKTVRSNKPTVLPLISYYGTGRLWKEGRRANAIFSLSSRLSGYKYCLEPNSNSKMLLDWFKTMEISTLQKGGFEKGYLDTVKKAVSGCIEGWDGVFYDIREDDLMGFKGKGKKDFLPFKLLSDGQRNVIGLIADIAIRCVTLNPHLKEEATRLTNGIVLIDELDLHLHPNWQKRIVEDLKRTFPKIQFFVTTHSPFIVQSLKNDELINLDAEHDMEYYKHSIEEIAETMGVEDVERSQKFKEMTKAAEEYYNLIRIGKSTKKHKEVAFIKKQLDDLLILFDDDPTYVALLKAERQSELQE